MPYVFENDVVIAFNRKECEELVNLLWDWKRDTLNGHKSQRHDMHQTCPACSVHTNTAATLLELFEAFGIDIDDRSQS